MKEFPLVTCFMLTYNHFEYVYEALESILAQDYPRIELGIFDDGSDCFPREKIETYISKNKRENIVNVIIHQNEMNLGTVKNINNCVRMTNGIFLLSATADDMFCNKEAVSDVVRCFLDTDADIVTCYREVTDETGNVITHAPAKRTARLVNTSTPIQLFKLISMGIAIAGAGTYYTRGFLEKVGLFDEQYILQEDGPMFLNATRKGYRMVFLEKSILRYRQGKGVSSGSHNSSQLINDAKTMFEKEVYPYIEIFNHWERRRIKYQVERLNYPKVLSRKVKFKFLVRYPDVAVYRRIMSR